MKQCEKAAYTVINKCMALKSKESILVLADDPCMDTANILYEICSRRTKHAALIQLPVRRSHLVRGVGDMLRAMDCAVLLTGETLSHTPERRQACKNGARILSMPNMTREMFCRLASMNFEKIARLSQKVSDILSMAHDVHVSHPMAPH
ncbi:MAG: hypothetical protein U5R06_20485 [candidate division KSB1 bacterium]|nr:hypothetical protein [candidate division KSB1 bacterium]